MIISNYKQNKIKLYGFSRSVFFALGFLLFSWEAQATGLQKAKTLLEKIKSEFLSIIPIIAIITLMGLAVGYLMGAIQKETLIRWVVGVIIIGSAAPITQMLLGSN